MSLIPSSSSLAVFTKASAAVGPEVVANLIAIVDFFCDYPLANNAFFNNVLLHHELDLNSNLNQSFDIIIFLAVDDSFIKVFDCFTDNIRY